MDSLSVIAASGLRSRMEALDLIANNMANTSAAGFKADRQAFSSYLSPDADLETNSRAPISPTLESNWTDFRQGEIRTTGMKSDIALSGDGFLVVQGKTEALLSRGGSFAIQTDGRLTTADGYPLHSTDGTPLRVDPQLELEIRPDGTVIQSGITRGQLRVVQPQQMNALTRQSGLYFSLDAESYRNLARSNAAVVQGAVEGSNLGPAESAARMITVMRQFESMQKAVQIGSEMGRRVTEDVARVHG